MWGRRSTGTAVLLFVGVTVSLAGLCPNRCSGHGECLTDPMGTCRCHIRREVDVGVNSLVPDWMGPDCSQRTCPLGRAWAAPPQANDDHTQRIECSGNGKCNRKTGVCACFERFSGDRCTRDTCPNNCNGHGQCLTIKAMARDYSFWANDDLFDRHFSAPMYVSGVDEHDEHNSVSYTGARYNDAWDANHQYGCKCDKQYRGGDCSEKECPSQADVMGGAGNTVGMDCSGRGICDYKTGLCDCFRGYYGVACQSLDEIWIQGRRK